MSASDPESSGHYHHEIADTAAALDEMGSKGDFTGTLEDIATASDNLEWKRELTQDGYLVGCGLLIAGLIMLLMGIFLCNNFIQGVAGNIFAAGCGVILFKWLTLLADCMKESPNQRVGPVARWFRLKG